MEDRLEISKRGWGDVAVERAGVARELKEVQARLGEARKIVSKIEALQQNPAASTAQHRVWQDKQKEMSREIGDLRRQEQGLLQKEAALAKEEAVLKEEAAGGKANRHIADGEQRFIVLRKP
jgi:chromosome segregation ATPase